MEFVDHIQSMEYRKNRGFDDGLKSRMPEVIGELPKPKLPPGVKPDRDEDIANASFDGPPVGWPGSIPKSELAGSGAKSLDEVLKGPRPAESTQPGEPVHVKKLYEAPPKCKCCTNWVEQYPEDLKEAADLLPDSSSYPIVCRYTKSHIETGHRALKLHSFTINDTGLRRALGRVFKFYPGIDTDLKGLTFKAPFQPFFHRWDALKEEKTKCEHDKVGTAQQIQSLIDELNEDFKRDTENFQQSGLPRESNADGQFYLLSEASYVTPQQQKPFFKLNLAYLDYDGTRCFGWDSSSTSISEFNGICKIAELEVTPQKYHPSGSRSRVLERGQKATQLLQSSHLYKAYKGIVTVDSGRNYGSSSGYVDGRIIIDAVRHANSSRYSSLYLKSSPPGLRNLVTDDRAMEPIHKTPDSEVDLDSGEQPSYYPEPRRRRRRRRYSYSDRSDSRRSSYADLKNADPFALGDNFREVNRSEIDSQKWTKEVLGCEPELLFTSIVRGYCLTKRGWAEFKIDNIKDISWNHAAFDSLVMNATRKKILLALVDQHRKRKVMLDDVIEGKGQGLIVLLKGPPGTGKTLTAESIADRLKLPLYSLQASELGEDASDVEERFAEILRLAASWDAVLLLDEADAFLEKRSQDPIFPYLEQRNKRVAAFLRILEYYKGVLLLTTNRQIGFDEAFQSRIHLSLKFPSLDEDSRRVVWQNFLKRAEAQVEKEEIAKLSLLPMNGRQIKNVVKMAGLSADSEESPLEYSHVEEVLEVVQSDLWDSVEARSRPATPS